MDGSREIQRISIGILILLTAVALAAAYWAVSGPDTILQRADNPRQFEALARIRRGSIYDAEGQLLAESRETDSVFLRRYLRPSTYSLVGYYSLRYGTGLTEAAFHDLLNGSDEVRGLDDFISRNLLKLPQTGADIQLTVSAELQDQHRLRISRSRWRSCRHGCADGRASRAAQSTRLRSQRAGR